MKRIVITGASGWLGTSMIASLVEIYGKDIIESLELYGSKAGSLLLDNQNPLEIMNLKDFKPGTDIDLFIPMAFLTQEKYNSLGPQNYNSINDNIISKHIEILNTSQVKTCVSFSSGIVTREKETLVRPPSFWAYKDAKLKEERKTQATCMNSGTILIACRLFSISGRHMKDPLKYALGNFISQAKTQSKIDVTANHPVFRKYVADEDLCHLILHLVKMEESVNFESSGHLTELVDLAYRVANHFILSKNDVRIAERESDVPDTYASGSNKMETLFADARLPIRGLDKQIADTVAGLLASRLV